MSGLPQTPHPRDRTPTEPLQSRPEPTDTARATPERPRRPKRGPGDGYVSQRKGPDGRPLPAQWRGELMVGWKTVTPEGKPAEVRPDVRYVSGVSRRDVTTKLGALRQQLLTGALPANDRRTVESHLRAWLAEVVLPNRRRGTYVVRRVAIERYLVPQLGALPLRDLRPAHVQRLYAALAARHLSTESIASVAATLSGALTNAVRVLRLLPANPAAGVPRPRTHAAAIRPLTRDAARTLLAHSTDELHPWLAPLITLALGTGARLGEILALRWTDVDATAGTIRIARTQDPRSGATAPRYHEPKTAGSRRTITLGTETRAALATWRRTHNTLRLAAGPEWQDAGGLVLTQPEGSTLAHTTVRQAFKAALHRAGLPKGTRIHDLRHTHATLLLLAGVNVHVVSQRLGHSAPSITLNRYGHLLPGLQSQGAEAIDQLLYDPTGSYSGAVPAATPVEDPTTRLERTG